MILDDLLLKNGPPSKKRNVFGYFHYDTFRKLAIRKATQNLEQLCRYPNMGHDVNTKPKYALFFLMVNTFVTFDKITKKRTSHSAISNKKRTITPESD